MSLPSETQVLIVGAGPTGLVTGITLAKLGLQVVIVDSSPENQNGSRASVLHAHTLEVKYFLIYADVTNYCNAFFWLACRS